MNVGNKHIIRIENYKKELEKLKKFSETLPKETSLPSLPTESGLFGWFDYNVTGNDINGLTNKIQSYLIEQNKIIVTTIKEFDIIYKALTLLDTEYIQQILSMVKINSKQQEQLNYQQNELERHQNELQDIILELNKHVDVLKKHKEKIEKISHITDVDKMFDSFKAIENNQDFFRNLLTQEMEKIVELSSALDSIETLIEKQSKAIETVENNFKIQGKSIEDTKKILFLELKILKERLSIQDEDIREIKTFIEKTYKNQIVLDKRLEQKSEQVEAITKKLNKINHLQDIDSIWNKIVNYEKEMSFLIEKQNINFEIIKKNQDIIMKLEENEEKNNIFIEHLSKKIKYVSIVAWSSLGIALIELMIIFTRRI